MTHTVVIFSQHLKLESLKSILSNFSSEEYIIFLTTHRLFSTEKNYLKNIHNKCIFLSFSDLLTDADMEFCDTSSDIISNQNVDDYYSLIKKKKNSLVLEHLKSRYPINKGIILSNDLGIDEEVWEKAGFERDYGEYYWTNNNIQTSKTNLFSKIKNALRLFQKECSIASFNGEKHVFYGRMDRIKYRLNITFTPSRIEGIIYGLEHILYIIFKFHGFKRKITRLTTFHEFTPLLPNQSVKIMQDGYLPSNYSSRYMHYYPGNIEFYTWDKISLQTFNLQNLPAKIIPFRKKLFLPNPVFPKHIRKVLCVSSGAGDWTAIKNRSDEDDMIEAFVQIAKRFPNIEFIYRCHPVWVIPLHQGVNSIQRVIDYFTELNLPNLKVSSNIPPALQNGEIILSYKRSSLEDDLKDVDIVFGEHSISMIDAAFKKLIFASINVTGRRNLFQSITDLGFPHCETVDEIIGLLENINTTEFQTKYTEAIFKYNKMIDQD